MRQRTFRLVLLHMQFRRKVLRSAVGTPILVQKDSKTYKYTITNLDASKGTGTVTDQSVSGGKTLTIKVGDYVPKVVITIGYVGYLLVATESIEGLIILGLVVSVPDHSLCDRRTLEKRAG